MQRGHPHAPRAARRAVAARQRQRREMPEPPPRGGVDQHDLAAPGRAVVAMPVPVEGYAEQRSSHAVLGGDRRDMRRMMLDLHHRPAGLLGPARGMEVGMQVAGDRLRFDIKDLEEVADRLGMEAHRRCVVEAADMLGDEGFAPARHRDGRFQVRADGKHVRPVAAEIDRLRHEAARASQEGRRAVDDRHHRIVGAGHDRAVVRDDEVGDPGEFLMRLVVADDERLAARIGARRHQHESVGSMPGDRVNGRSGRNVEDQMMRRRIGQHDAEPREPRRDGRSEHTAVLNQHDRPRRLREQAALRRSRRSDAVERGEVRDHHREGLGLARLAPAQLGDRAFVRGVAHQVEAADSLERDDLAGTERVNDRRNRMRQARAADGAADRLGMEAAVGRVVVVARAGCAHGEGRHRGLRPVVGEPARQREARAAMRAGDERIPVETACRIEHIVEAGLAHRRVRHDAGAHGPAFARRNRKACIAQRGEAFDLDRIDAGERRRRAAQAVEEFSGAHALDLEGDAVGSVAHEAAELEPGREPIGERAEAHALHGATHAQPQAHRPVIVLGGGGLKRHQLTPLDRA